MSLVACPHYEPRTNSRARSGLLNDPDQGGVLLPSSAMQNDPRTFGRAGRGGGRGARRGTFGSSASLRRPDGSRQPRGARSHRQAPRRSRRPAPRGPSGRKRAGRHPRRRSSPAADHQGGSPQPGLRPVGEATIRPETAPSRAHSSAGVEAAIQTGSVGERRSIDRLAADTSIVYFVRSWLARVRASGPRHAERRSLQFVSKSRWFSALS
jgi:hypothetical protein